MWNFPWFHGWLPIFVWNFPKIWRRITHEYLPLIYYFISLTVYLITWENTIQEFVAYSFRWCRHQMVWRNIKKSHRVFPNNIFLETRQGEFHISVLYSILTHKNYIFYAIKQSNLRQIRYVNCWAKKKLKEKGMQQQKPCYSK